MANLFQPSIARATDSNGASIPGANLYFYLTGTTTLASVFTDQAGSTASTNPVIADSAGLFVPVYIDKDSTYRVILKNADDSATIYDIDPVRGFDESTAANQTAADVASTTADAIATAADRVQTGLDRAATAADVISTAANAASTAGDVILTAADVVLAEAAAASTGLGGALYATTAAGLAAVAEGEYFYVKNASGNYVEYQDLSGVATATGLVVTGPDYVASSIAATGALSDSIAEPVDQRIGKDTTPVLDLSLVTNKTARCSEAVTVESKFQEIGIYVRNNGNLTIKALNSSDVVTDEVVVAMTSGTVNLLDETDVPFKIPAGGRWAIFDNANILSYSSSGSSPSWSFITGDYASGGGFASTVYIQAYAIMRSYIPYVDYALIKTLEDDYLESTHLTDYVVETLGAKQPLTTADTTGLGTNTFVLQEAAAFRGELAWMEVVSRKVGTFKLKIFSGNDVDGLVLENVPPTLTLAIGTQIFTPADFGEIIIEEGEHPATYNAVSSTVAYGSGETTPAWIMSGDATSGTPTGTLNSQIRVRYHFKRKEATGARVRRDYNYDVSTGSQLMKSTMLSSIGGIDFLVIGLGQSLSIGSNADAADVALTTTAEHSGYGLMANCGVRPEGAAITSYVDLVEADDGNSHETPAAGCVSAIIDRLYARHGRKPRVIYAIAGQGGMAYAGGPGTAGEDLKRGSDTYAEGLRVVRECNEVSKALGRRLIVIAATVCHGEQDNTNSLNKLLYQRALDQWQSNIEEDYSRITGQTDPIPLYIYQTCRADPTNGASIGYPAQSALAQLAAPDRNPKIRGIGPMYYCPQAADSSHVTSRGYRWIGRQHGTFIAEDLFGPYYEPMRVVSSYWSTTSKFCLQFNKAITIESDDTKVVISTLGNGKGIDFDDGSGSAPTISSIAVKAGTTDTVEVTLSGAPSGLRKRAWVAARRNGGNGSGNTTGSRSGIRSTATFDVDPQNSANLYHWACQQEIVL